MVLQLWRPAVLLLVRDGQVVGRLPLDGHRGNSTKLGSSLFNLEGYATKCIFSGKADFGFYNICVIGILLHVHVCALQNLVSLVRYQSLPSIA